MLQRLLPIAPRGVILRARRLQIYDALALSYYARHEARLISRRHAYTILMRLLSVYIIMFC